MPSPSNPPRSVLCPRAIASHQLGFNGLIPNTASKKMPHEGGFSFCGRQPSARGFAGQEKEEPALFLTPSRQNRAA
jgi:hypothetical protein